MKRLLTIFGLLVLFAGVLRAQDCPFKVKFTVTPATCYNNGKVAYALVDDAGEVLTTVPADLSRVRIYFKESVTDSAHFKSTYYNGGWDTLVIEPGSWIIGVEALCYGGPGIYSRLDTNHAMTVPTSYITPQASVINTVATSSTGYGTRPTLTCANTGRVQLKIEGGRFPFSIKVADKNTSALLKTVVFDTNQYSGTYAGTSYNYKDYYSIDSLPAGDWTFQVEDGCGYGMPKVEQTVGSTEFPQLQHIELYFAPQNQKDTNITYRIKTVFNSNLGYYLEQRADMAEYRFTYDGFASKDWKSFPKYSYKDVTIYDTVFDANRYCDIWGKDITFEYRLNGCGDQTFTKTFQLNSPNLNYFSSYVDGHDTYSYDTIYFDKENCTEVRPRHTRSNYIRYQYGTTTSSTYSAEVDDSYYHQRYCHHYTAPLIWTYTDANTNNVIKKDTIQYISGNSFLRDTTIARIYGSFKDAPLTITVKRSLVDAKGCQIYEDTRDMTYRYDTTKHSSYWGINYSSASSSDYCCGNKRSVWVSMQNNGHYKTTEYDADGTIIRLVKSPYNNRYNFEAVYSSSEMKWTVVKSNLENTAEINSYEIYDEYPNVIGFAGDEIEISDYCLPSGPYQFEIITPCDSYNLSTNASFADYYTTEIVEQPVKVEDQECSDRWITYTAGKFRREMRNTDRNTGLDLAPRYQELTTKIKVIRGTTGGYDNVEYGLNEPIRLSMPGRYIFDVYPTYGNSSVTCDRIHYYDTIDYPGGTVAFNYATALLCDSTSTTGNVFVKGSNGTEPYHYTLYSEPDQGGAILASGNDGIFANVPMNVNSAYSCLVTDACNSYFYVNVYPKTLANMQKAWWDGDLTETETCEGTEVYINAIEVGDVFTYIWTGPDGFTDTVSRPYVFIPRGSSGSGDGWYKVEISNTGCSASITDSVHLTVMEAPTLTIETSDVTVCPGEEVEVKFTPNSPVTTADAIKFTMAFSNGNGIEKRSYSAAPGETVTDTYITYGEAKVYSASINDGRCDYTIADDTMKVNMRTDIANSCNMTITYDSSCYNDNAHLTVQSSLGVPYTIKWYGDYELTDLRKVQTVTSASDLSDYDTLGMTSRGYLFVSLEKEGICPTVHGIPSHTMNMSEGSTVLDCGHTYRLYDSGGKDANYGSQETFKHEFSTVDGKPIVLRFDELSLAQGSHLYVINGTQTLSDSLICDLTQGSAVPDMLVSNSGTMTLFFVGSMQTAAGWSATIEYAPEMAVVNVREKNDVTIAADAKQSQTNSYNAPAGIVPNVASAAELNEALRKAGTHTFTKIFENGDRNGCDSTVNFVLTVKAPVYKDTTVVITNMHQESYTWHGNTYNETGRYAHLTTLPDGSDSLDILNLIVLQIDTTENEICRGDSTVMGITVTEPRLENKSELIPHTIVIGDVLCTDGTFMNVDSFLTSGKSAKGVVFYVDKTGEHGLACALSGKNLSWARYEVQTSVRSLLTYSNDPLRDFDGAANTEEIKRTAELAEGHDFATNAPAAHYCYYYDHNIMDVGTEPQGWYLPAIGELVLLTYAGGADVESTLIKLKSSIDNVTDLYESHQYGSYRSSTEYTGSYSRGDCSWEIQFNGYLPNTIEGDSRKNYAGYVKPIIKF